MSRDSATGTWLRIVLLIVVSALLVMPHMSGQHVDVDNGQWYRIFSHDAIAQERAGIFPVYVGNSQYLFTGWADILTIFYNVVALADLLSGRTVAPSVLVNLVVVFFGILNTLLPYAALRAITPGRPWLCAALSVLFATCPGVISPLLTSGCYNTFVETPFIPPVFAACYIMTRRRSVRAAGLGALCSSFLFMMHAPSGLLVITLAALFLGTSLVALPDMRRPIMINGALYGVLLVLTLAWYVTAVLTTGAHETSVYHVTAPSSFFVSRDMAEFIVRSGASELPDVFLPIDRGRPNAMLQLGYALYAVAACLVVRLLVRTPAMLWPMASRDVRERWQLPFAACLLVAVIMNFPIPHLSIHLWLSLPHIYEIVTTAPLRLYRILAALIVVWAALFLPLPGGPTRRAFSLTRYGLSIRIPAGDMAAVAILALIGWSGWETSKIVAVALEHVIPPYQMMEDRSVLPDYVWDYRKDYNRGFSIHIDGALLNRVVAGDGRVLLDNVVAAEAPCREGGGGGAFRPRILPLCEGDETRCQGFDITEIRGYSLRAARCGPMECRIRSTPYQRDEIIGDITLPPGTRGIYAFDLEIGRSETQARNINVGIYRDGEPYLYTDTVIRASGSYHLSLENGGDRPRHFKVLVSTFGAEGVIRNSCAALYTPASLPVRPLSRIGYAVTVEAPGGGALLETPLLARPGFAAEVNGRPVPLPPPARGLVTVPLAEGGNTVRVWYAGSPLLPLSLAVSLAAAVLILAYAAAPRGFVARLLAVTGRVRGAR